MRPLPWLKGSMLGLVLAGLVPVRAGAQALAPGDRIRARTPDGPIEATVVAVTDTSLVLERKLARDTFSVPFDNLSDVRVAMGRHGSGAASGVLGVVGSVLGGIGMCRLDSHLNDCYGVGGALGGALGVGLGQLVKVDRWIPVTVAPPPPSADTLRTLAAPRADSVRSTP